MIFSGAYFIKHFIWSRPLNYICKFYFVHLVIELPETWDSHNTWYSYVISIILFTVSTLASELDFFIYFSCYFLLHFLLSFLVSHLKTSLISVAHSSSKEKFLLPSKFNFNSFIAVNLEVQPYLLTPLKDSDDVVKQIGEFTEHFR